MKIILGGPLAITETDACLEHADYVCIWDSYNILDLFDYIEGRKKTFPKNFVSREKTHKKYLNIDLDKIPCPDYNSKNNYLFFKDKFKNDKNYFPKIAYLESIKGCLFDCSYCSIPYFSKIRLINSKSKLAFRSMKLVVKDLRKTMYSGGNKIEAVYVSDDNFLFNSLEDIKLFVKEFNKYTGKHLIIAADLRLPDFIEKFKEIIKLKQEVFINIGVQSGSEKFNLNVFNRPQKNKKVIEANEKIQELIKDKKNISVSYYLIYANPLETKQDVVDSINIILRLKTPMFILAYTPLPLTELGEKLKDEFKEMNDWGLPSKKFYSKNGFYYTCLFIINILIQKKFFFLLPKQFKVTKFNEFLNDKIKIWYLLFLSKKRLNELTNRIRKIVKNLL